MISNTPAITIYNRYYDPSTKSEKYQRTVLRDVTWETTKGRSILSTGGTMAANQAVVYILFEKGANYLSPKRFLALADKTGKWTLADKDLIVREEAAEELSALFTPTQLKAKYDDVLEVTSVDAMDNGSLSMRHWEVGLK